MSGNATDLQWFECDDEGGREGQQDVCAAGRFVGVVADGMGGHEGGARAAQAAVDAMLEELSSAGATAEDLEHAFSYAAAQVVEEGGGGTTLVAALLERGGGPVSVAWVGDSRAYLVREDEVELLSEDHSGPDGGLSRWLPDEPCPDMVKATLEPGELLVLCTDGVWGVLDDSEWLSALDADDPAEWLVGLALEAGTSDNCAVVACRRV